jgi:hypothetical protein
MTLSGDGTITGLVAGGLPDATITTDELAAGAALNNAPNSVGFRNRIINGDMRIDQRNAGAAVTTTTSYPVDRFRTDNTSDGAFSAQQDSSAPAGFVNSLKWTTTTADTNLGQAQRATIHQYIEGTNVADLGWGTANAKTVTLSFWVRSSLTGSFGGSMENANINRSYPFTYSISSADTWEYKTVTVAGDTTGTWLTTTGLGIRLFFSMGVGTDFLGTAGSWAAADYRSATGATSVIGTLNATFYITGVQLEVGSVATPFERRPYGTELALCQRYYYKTVADAVGAPFANGYSYTTTESAGVVQFAIPMRTRPTALEQTGTAGDYYIAYGATSTACSSVPTYSNASKECSTVIFTISSGLTVGQGIRIGGQTAAGYLAWSAEL